MPEQPQPPVRTASVFASELPPLELDLHTEAPPVRRDSRLAALGRRALRFVTFGRYGRPVASSEPDEIIEAIEGPPERLAIGPGPSSRSEFGFGDAITVTEVIGANAIHFTSTATGEPAREPLQLGDDGVSAKVLADHLGAMYLNSGLGRGTHSPGKIATSLKWGVMDVIMACQALETQLPPGVFARGTGPHRTDFTIGNISLAARLATPEEEADYNRRRVERVERAFSEQREALDDGKETLTSHDHSVVIVDGHRYQLPLDTSDAILATRILQVLGDAEDQPQVRGHAVARNVWDRMTTTERELFTSSQAGILSGGSEPIIGRVEDILHSLTSQLGVTKRVAHDLFNIASLPHVRAHINPPRRVSPGTCVIFAPGTPPEAIRTYTTRAVSEDSLRQAQQIVTESQTPSDRPLSEDAAKALLDFIMSRPGKRALEVVLHQSDGPSPRPPQHSLTSVLSVLHGNISRVLGDTYAEACRKRMRPGYRPANAAHVRLDRPAARAAWPSVTVSE